QARFRAWGFRSAVRACCATAPRAASGIGLALEEMRSPIRRAALAATRHPNPARSTMRRTPVHVLPVVAALAVALTGCSRMPTAPPADPSLEKPASNPGIVQTEDPAPPPITPGIPNSVRLEVGEAGTIQYGAFTVQIHKNSLKMPATITV